MNSPNLSARCLVAAVAIAAFATTACKRDRQCKPRGDHSVVACFDDDEITADEVEPFLRPAMPIPGRAELPDPRPAAVDAAIRVRLFAAEARRRDLPGGDGPEARTRAVLNQALIRAEVKRLGIGAETISDEDAQRYHDEHPDEVSPLEAVRCRAIFVDDPALAEDLYRRAVRAGEQAFAALAGEHSDDPSAANGGDLGVIDRRDPTVDVALIRLALSLRRAGDVGGPVKLADGRYVLLHATAVELDKKLFEGKVIPSVKNHMAQLREREALDALDAELRGKHDVRVLRDELAKMPVP